MSSKVLIKNAAWSAANHLLARGSLVVVSMILARNLDSSGFAAYSLFQLTISMIAAYAALGFGVTASRFFSEFQGATNVKRYPVGALWVLSIIGGVVALVVTLILPAGLIEEDLDIPRWLLAVGVFSTSLGIVPAGAVLGLEQYRKAFSVACVTASFLFFGSYAAVKFQSPVSAMWVLVISNAINAVGNFLVTLHIVGIGGLLSSARLSKDSVGAILKFAGPMVGVSLLSASGSWLVGRIILSGPSGPENFALYAIGIQWMALALFLPGMVSRVLLPRLVKMQNELHGTDSESRKLVSSGAMLALIFAILLAIIGVVLSPLLIALYGTNLAINQWLLAAFLVAAIPSAPANTVGNAIVARDGQRAWFTITFLWFFTLIALTLLFSDLGVWAGAVSHGVASLILIFLSVCFARKRTLL
ncbi:oligosaccharide flippase family protein [Marinobacter profundi]|uniref:oligosaccharide flippase family protein n=1 Tax=Marinobacter profundi TaxID=2666256 RepID=UPI0014757CAB|nr:oligosaccharide flippase family protein [Marinobacter profundi]